MKVRGERVVDVGGVAEVEVTVGCGFCSQHMYEWYDAATGGATIGFIFFYWDGVVVCRDQRLEAARPLSHFDEAVKTPFQLAPPTAQLHTFNWHPPTAQTQLHNCTTAHLTPPSQRRTQTN